VQPSSRWHRTLVLTACGGGASGVRKVLPACGDEGLACRSEMHARG